MTGMQGSVELDGRTRRGRERAIVATLQLLLLTPFLAKPVHIDDAFFLAIAEHILRDPWRPYDFLYNWTGTPGPVWSEMKNPPLVFYLQALLVRLGGESERWLHGAFLVFPLIAGQATYSLARRVTAQPLYPVALLMLCPAYWVSATSLMVDVPLVALLLVAVASLARADETGRPGALITASLAAAAAVLAKYFALAWLPLLWIQALWMRGGARRKLVVLAAPLAAFGVWAWWGDGHLMQAIGYRSGQRATLGWLVSQIVSLPTFTAGLLVFPVAWFVAMVGDPAQRGVVLICAGFAIAVLALRLALLPSAASPPNELLLLLGCTGTLAFVIRSFASWPDADAPMRRLLLLWLAAGLGFAALGNWTLNARTILLFAPPAALVFAWQSEGRARLRAGALVASGCVGLAVVLADVELARFGPAEAARARADFPELRASGADPDGARLRFVGHWGFQHYMERAGFEHVDLRQPDPRPGDVVLIPQMHRVASMSLESLPSSRGTDDLRVRRRRLPLAVMSGEAGAGLHGSFLGHLPYAFTREPLERVEVRRW